MSKTDDILVGINNARILYDRADLFIKEALTIAQSLPEAAHFLAEVRKARHDLAKPLTVIYNAKVLLKTKPLTVPEDSQRPSTETKPPKR
jgi:hypothetical protein